MPSDLVVKADMSYTAPDHVPQALVWNHDIDVFAQTLDDPFRLAELLRSGPEIIWAAGCAAGKPGWVPTRFELVQEVFMDHERFSAVNMTGTSDMLGVDWALNPMEFDPPDHAIYRRVLQPWFQPSVINHLDATIREGCESIIRPFADRGHCEFVGEFASKFPSQITLKLLGLPLDRVDAFLELEHDYLRGEVAEKIAAAGAILRCLEEVVEEKRRAPSDDLISRIVTAEIDGRRLNHGEVMGMCMLLYIGGLDTVTSSLGWYLRHLAQDQALQSRLRANPKEIPLAIEELLRLYGVSGTNRHVAKDCEFHGVTMKAGDRIAVPAMLAGRDPDRYQNPNVFDINRNNRHITFGTGVHNCLGSHLARREIRVVIEEFLARFTNIRIADGGTVAWLTEGIGPWGVSHLPLAWDTSPRS